jgi:hypothetical protein
MSHTRFPKAWALGHRNTLGIWDGHVEITEKVDGSQIGFGIVDGRLVVRSKNTEVHKDAAGMFHEAVEYIHSIEHKLAGGHFYYGEYLKKPKHNTIEYSRIPLNHIALFGVKRDDGTFIKSWEVMESIAEQLCVDIVPMIHYGPVSNETAVHELLKRESFLGGHNIEGIVVKNYEKDIVIADQWVPFTQAKYVSEEFKEKHIKGWTKNPDKLQALKDQYRTEARWLKAVQTLRDNGMLENDPRDIGKLMKYFAEDLEAEESDGIKEELYQIYRKDIIRFAQSGLAEWYKAKLLGQSFDMGEERE